MIIHRLTMLTENDSSEHLLAKIKLTLNFSIYNQIVTKTFQLTNVFVYIKRI
jgi:hypothetical protein